jgi:hypothetical protein
MKNSGIICLNGNKLPYVNEIIKGVVNFSATYDSLKQRKAILCVLNYTYNLWSKIFHPNDLIFKSLARKKLLNILKLYEKKIRKTGFKRAEEKLFFIQYNYLFDLLRPNIAIKKKAVELFYKDQKSKRIFIIEDLNDEDYEDNQLEEEFEKDAETEAEAEEEVEDEKEENEGGKIFSSSFNRSGCKRHIIDVKDVGTQTNNCNPNTLVHIRKNRLFSDKIKNALVLACVDASITINQCRKAFKSISKNFYGIDYYLNVSEVPEKNLVSKIPRKITDFQSYEFVLPSYRTISEARHKLAIAAEGNAALALLEKNEDVKATLHYDTTSRKKIRGEQTSMILSFSNGKTFNLRPLPIACENRDTISKFFIEEIERLAVIGNCDPKLMWEQVNAIMTDAVAKNLGIEAIIAENFGKITLSINNFRLILIIRQVQIINRTTYYVTRIFVRL